MVVKFILVALLSDIQNQHIRVQSDNTTVISFNYMNGSQSAEWDKITYEDLDPAFRQERLVVRHVHTWKD